MTRDEIKQLLMMVQSYYPNFNPPDKRVTIKAWEMALQDQSYKLMEMSLLNYVRADASGFAPTIGQLMQKAQEMTTPDNLTETQAWSLVQKAITKSGWWAKEEFEKLPEQVQKAVGTPEELRSMALDSDFNEQVASSNFMRSYRTVIERENTRQLYTSKAQGYIAQTNTNSPRVLFESGISNGIAIPDVADVVRETVIAPDGFADSVVKRMESSGE